MSVVTQLGVTDPNLPWILASLPIAVGLDLALGDLPGRTYPIRAMNRLISAVDDGVGRTVARVGGGRGGDLFGGLMATTLIVGTPTSLIWLSVDLADQVGGPASLLARVVWIAAGLVIRAAGDAIVQAAESPDMAGAGRALGALGGQAPRFLTEAELYRACIAAVGEVALSRLIAPLCWLAVAGPAGMWGMLTLQSLRNARLAQGRTDRLAGRVPILLADLAEWLPGLLTWLLLCLSAAFTARDAGLSWRAGWQAIRRYPGTALAWSQATLGGALGVQFDVRRLADGDSARRRMVVGLPIHQPDRLRVILGMRLMQVATLLGAGGVEILTLLLS